MLTHSSPPPQVIATDADGPEFGTLLYSLSDGFNMEDHHPLFQIHPHTGELCVSQDIDRDSGPTLHDILIRAEDPVGDPSALTSEPSTFSALIHNFPLVLSSVPPSPPQGGLSAQTYVHVEVEDLNDNAPVFNPDQYTMSISCHTQPGSEILNVIATDRDSGSFGEVTYQLLTGDMSSLFALDTQTGMWT